MPAIALLVACCPVVTALATPLPDLAVLKVERPELLVPGSTHVLPGTEPPGYVICSAVTRYFDDETQADLDSEIDLVAKQQLVRFLMASSPDHSDVDRGAFDVSGFRRHAVWWEADALHGLYFVPAEGVRQVAAREQIQRTPAVSGRDPDRQAVASRDSDTDLRNDAIAGPASAVTEPENSGQNSGPVAGRIGPPDPAARVPMASQRAFRSDPTELLLQGRTLRKRGEFAAAREVFDRVRQEFPLSPQARRALHEIYLANTAKSAPVDE